MPQPQAQLPRPPSQQQLQPEEECNSSSSFAMFSSPSIDQGASHLSNPSSNHEPQDLNAGGSGSLSRGHSPGVVPRPDSGDSGSGSGSGTPPLRRKGKGRKIRRFSEMTNFDFEGEPPLHNPWTFKRSDAPERHMQRLSVDLLFGPKPGDDKQMTRSEAKESIQRLIRHASSTGAYGESHMALAAAAAVVAADGDKASPSAAGPPLRHTVSLDPNAVRAYAIMSDSGDEA